MFKQKDEPAMSVSVTGPEKKGGHNFYSIIGKDTNGQFNVVRRFCQFQNLRDTLVARWPGCYVPGLPQRRVLRNQDRVFVQIRKQGLQYFVDILKNSQFIWYSQQAQLFFRKQGWIQKQMQKLKQTSSSQILSRYRNRFPSYLNRQISEVIGAQIDQFNQYLKIAAGLLQNLQKMTQQILNSRKKLNINYLNLIDTLLPEYQDNCMKTYIDQECLDRMIFTGQKGSELQDLHQILIKKDSPAVKVLQEIKREKSQIAAFQFNLKVKQNYSALRQKAITRVQDLQMETAKISSGKQSFLQIINNKSKDDKLKQNQTSIQKAQQEQKNLTQICEIIVLLLGESEIGKFKKTRENAYFKLLKEFFSLQKEQSKIRIILWLSLSQGNHKNQEQQIQKILQASQEQKQTKITQIQVKQLKIENQFPKDNIYNQAKQEMNHQNRDQDEQKDQDYIKSETKSQHQGQIQKLQKLGDTRPKQNHEAQQVVQSENQQHLNEKVDPKYAIED